MKKNFPIFSVTSFRILIIMFFTFSMGLPYAQNQTWSDGSVKGKFSPDRIIPSQEFETSRPKLELDGEWEFAFDPDSIGMKEKWFSGKKSFPEITRVPGKYWSFTVKAVNYLRLYFKMYSEEFVLS